MKRDDFSHAEISPAFGLTWCGMPVDSLVQPEGCTILFVKGRRHTIFWAGPGMYEASFPDDDTAEWRRIFKTDRDITRHVLMFNSPPASAVIKNPNDN